MVQCKLCGYEFDENQSWCQGSCPMASVQGCHLLCCPNCGYQTVDEKKSGLARLASKFFKVGRPDTSDKSKP